MMWNRIAVVLGCLALSGCLVPNEAHRKGLKAVIDVPRSGAPKDDPNCDATKQPCLAFIEFDEMGEFHDPGGVGAPSQLDRALELIKRTREKNPKLVVITFLHGWKNNSADRKDNSGNVYAFEQTLKSIAVESGYCPSETNCPNPVVGVYLSWRGDLISKYWPVSRQLSYFNRESTAIRIPGASMTSAISEITRETRKVEDATLIMVGHSFGALVLERALSQPMADYILRKEVENPADLIVFVNSAAAANEAKQMLDLLKKEALHYEIRGENRPVWLSISSVGDSATRAFLPIGHGPGFLGRKMTGSWRDDDPPYGYQGPKVSQSSYYLSTAAHMELLQSHRIVGCAEDGDAVVGEIKLTGGPCFKVVPKPGRWNDTPYWVMQMPVAIVPDHSTIFNLKFIQLLKAFLPTSRELEKPRTETVNGVRTNNRGVKRSVKTEK